MRPRTRVFFLIGIMVAIVFVAESTTMFILYTAALHEERSRLKETAQSQARLMEAIAKFDLRSHSDATRNIPADALKLIVEAHAHYQSFSKTGEFTLAKRQGDSIMFLITHGGQTNNNPTILPFQSNLAEPMRLALMERSGTMIGLDYKGVKVMAAYEPVSILNLGIVAKIDMAEIRAPFIRAGLISAVLAVLAIVAGTFLFIGVTEPLVRNLEQSVNELTEAMGRVKQLSGMLPICASCKKIRNDAGYWTQIESYIKEHSEAEFTHGICPECAEKLYPGISKKIDKN